MRLSCGEARRRSLAAIGGHATEAQRLQLEAHLAACAACTADHAALALVRRLKKMQPDPLLGSARERIRRTVLARRAPPMFADRRAMRPFALTAVFAVAAAMVLWRVLPLVGVGGPERVSGGDVSRLLSVRDWVKNEITFKTRWGGQVTLGDAVVILGADTEVVWLRSARTLTLHRGEVTADVEHRPDRQFLVETPRFRVEVVGTRFAVDLVGVRTYRGAVRVVRRGGEESALVSAGGVWSVDGEVASDSPPPEASLESPPPATVPPSMSVRPTAPTASTEKVDADPVPTPIGVGSAARLERARRWLARGEAGQARRVVVPLFNRERRFAAEARALYAESFLIQRRYGQAIHAYRVLARDFSATPQAESALFAVAQLQSEHGRPAEARKALDSYLSRYPDGRFAKEAYDRLQKTRTSER